MRSFRIHLSIIIAIALPLLCTMASAQDSNADSLVGIHSQPVTILSNIDSSIVIIDGERVGVTPLTLEKLTLGPHRLTLQNPDINSWLASGVTDTFRVMPGVPLTLRYKIEPRYIITSSPFDAEVVIGDSVIGKTPLAVNSEFLSYQSKSPSIRKLGYEPATLDLSSSRRGILSVSLKQIWQNDNDHEGIFRPNNGASSHTLRLTLSAASTVLSGAAAAYFKIKADDRYQSYRDTGDPALLSQTHRLDTGAGIALLAAQISLGLFTYFVLSN